jgi:tripartite-type tricarboxylate transporter receptor subunit TctC
MPKIARSQERWPNRPVRYVVGFAAGGATDSLSRVFCQKLGEVAGQQIVVENRPGAGGVVGTDVIAKAASDGYTIGMGGNATNVVAIGSFAKLPYRGGDDFTFITGLWKVPNVLVVRKDLPVNDLRQFLEYAKASPGQLTYGSSGIGATLHLSAEMLKSAAGVDIRHIPYKGAGPALIDLLGGRLDCMFDNVTGQLQAIREGTVKALGVTTRKRSAALPDVPAIDEVLPGFELTSWSALCAPAKLPASLIETINAQALKALTDQDLLKKFADMGAEAWPTTPAEITEFRDAEERKFLPIIKAAGVVPT